MAITITWGTKVIYIPQSYLGDPIVGTLYELDTDAFRLDLKDLEDSEEGIAFPDTHSHNLPVTVAGITYARSIEIINGYSITFEDLQYSIRLAGSNNNFFDVENGILNQNQVQVIPGNAAGLITDGTDFLVKTIKNKRVLTKIGSVWNWIVYDDDNITPVVQKEIKDKDGNNITDIIAGILAQELQSSV